MDMLLARIRVSALLVAAAGLEVSGSPHFPGATMCCNWRSKPLVSLVRTLLANNRSPASGAELSATSSSMQTVPRADSFLCNEYACRSVVSAYATKLMAAAGFAMRSVHAKLPGGCLWTGMPTFVQEACCLRLQTTLAVRSAMVTSERGYLVVSQARLALLSVELST